MLEWGEIAIIILFMIWLFIQKTQENQLKN